MKRTLLIVGALTLAASAAHAQACLSLSDGFGGTTVTCPDGRSGYLRTDPSGGVSGMIGSQPYAGTALGVNPAGTPAGTPSASYLTPPPPPAPYAPPPQSSAAGLEPLTPQPELTQLQREYQMEQQALRLRRAAKP